MAKRELAVSFDIVREKNLEQLKLLNSVIFPMKYAVSTPIPPDGLLWRAGAMGGAETAM